MSLAAHKVREARESLERLLDQEIARILEHVEIPYGPKNPLYIHIPDTDDAELGPDELGSLVARSSNMFQQASHNAAIVRAKRGLVENRYKKKYKRNLQGKNPSEREANGLAAAEEEYEELGLIEAIAELAEAQAISARIASESSRKLFDKSHDRMIGASREAHGYYKETDFVPQGNW